MILDFHMHSNTSPDNQLEIDQIYAAAVKKGLKYICITNHHEFCQKLSGMGFTLDEKKMKSYLSHLSNLKLDSTTTVFFGTEIGYWEDKEEEIKKFIESVNFDFVIGSVHGIQEIQLSNGQFRFNLENQPEMSVQQDWSGGPFLKALKSFNTAKELETIFLIDPVIGTPPSTLPNTSEPQLR